MPGSGRLAKMPKYLYLGLRWVFLLAVLGDLVLFGFNSLGRLRRFSPDSMNYADVARNIAAGRGLVQSTLGFNQPHWDPNGTIPTPITSQPPVYPLLIVLFHFLGVPLADAALLVSALSYGLVLLLAYLLSRELYDEHTALAATACLLLYFPLHFVSTYAWSEPVAIAFMLLSFWLLSRSRRTQRERALVPLLAGLAAGLAFATRYAFLPVFFLGVLLLIEPGDWPRTAQNLVLYAMGVAPLAGWVIARNLILSDTWLGPSRNPSTRGLGLNYYDMVKATFRHYLDRVSESTQDAAFKSSLVVFGLVLASLRKLGSTLEDLLLRGRRYVLTFWSFGYLALLIYQRTQSHFDRIGPRLIAPAGVALAILWATLFVKTTRLKVEYLIYPALLLAFLAILGEIQVMNETPLYNWEDSLVRSERLSWVAAHTTDRDLIVGDDTMDIPFYFGRTGAISFSPYPYTDHLPYEALMAYLEIHNREYEHVYLVLRNRYQAENAWRLAYGSFIADLVYKGTQGYPGIIYRRRLSDGYVFEIVRP
ncbi:MAG: glycosyltransferase family 39 protein [Anaerolineae bacterium]|nr:glycosyltransferase family 39 protein [Anaerolineae bacterium]